MPKPRQPDQTRRRLVEAALTEIHRRGFQAASLEDILADTGLTKGALYHHFQHKKELALAAVELMAQQVRTVWLEPLAQADDPITCLGEIIQGLRDRVSDEQILLGCPLNNLAQEMSPVDEEFRLALCAVYRQWQDGVAQALERARQRGLLREDCEPREAATFYVAALTGARGLAKTTRDADVLWRGGRSLQAYLEALRAPVSGD